MGASPSAVALGQTVEELDRPFIWQPGQKPYHVMDASRLKVSGPLRYRLYADRVENNVPISKEKFTMHPFNSTAAAPQFLQAMPPRCDRPRAGTEHLEEEITMTVAVM